MYRYSLITSLIIIFAVACSSTYQKPESVEEKMRRFSPRTNNSGIIPRLTINQNWEYQSTRAPASAEEVNTPNDYQSLNNKKIYFLTLLYQYNHLRPLSHASAPSITTCPHFHGTLLEYNKTFKLPSSNGDVTSKWSIDSKLVSLPDYLATHPELSLSVLATNEHPTLAESIATAALPSEHKEYLIAAIQNFTSTNYNELSELCQTGSSDNYFAFENLINYAQTERSMKPVPKDMSTLLKTSVFANHAVLSSLGRFATLRTVATENNKSWNYTNPMMIEISNRLKAKWALDYFKELKHN
jgi:hypothetical protein